MLALLVNLLQSVDCIERRLTETLFHQESLLDEKFDIQAVHAWQRDSEAASKLSRRERSWLRQVSFAKNYWL